VEKRRAISGAFDDRPRILPRGVNHELERVSYALYEVDGLRRDGEPIERIALARTHAARLEVDSPAGFANGADQRPEVVVRRLAARDADGSERAERFQTVDDVD
jgi:hypothetical protein